MVTITSFKKRKNSDGQEFNALVLEGDIEMILSMKTGKYYATTKSCTITSTLHEVMCQRLIGQQLPGSIEKVDCEPYEYQVPGTDEVITLKHTYFYRPVPDPVETTVLPLIGLHNSNGQDNQSTKLAA